MKSLRSSIFVFIVISLLVSGCGVGQVARDKNFVPQGYQKYLSSMNLIEVIPLPYFTAPFITIAKDSYGQQYAVVF